MQRKRFLHLLFVSFFVHVADGAHVTRNCETISVVGDATYCISGPLCAGTRAGNCPKANDAAVEHCHAYLSSYDQQQQACALVADTYCQVLENYRGQPIYGCFQRPQIKAPNTPKNTSNECVGKRARYSTDCGDLNGHQLRCIKNQCQCHQTDVKCQRGLPKSSSASAEYGLCDAYHLCEGSGSGNCLENEAKCISCAHKLECFVKKGARNKTLHSRCMTRPQCLELALEFPEEEIECQNPVNATTESSIDEQYDDTSENAESITQAPTSYRGRKSSVWFLVGGCLIALATISIAVIATRRYQSLYNKALFTMAEKDWADLEMPSFKIAESQISINSSTTD